MPYQIEQSPLEIFRAYDIRGKVDSQLNSNRVYTLGLAYARMAQGKTKAVVIGRDGRLSGPTLIEALQAGLVAGGLQVINLGAVPTPLCSFGAHLLETYSSIMVTGSHNPKEYNGLKLALAGETLFDAQIQALHRIIESGDFPDTAPGTVQHQSIEAQYIEALQHQIRLDRPLKIAIDCGNGIAGRIAPALYQALGCEVISLYTEVDGNFPHHHPDPSKPENLRDLIKTVISEGCDLGLAFDGDGDRLGMVTSTGEIIWPDRQMILFSRAVLAEQPGAKIIYDVKCTQTLPAAIRAAGGIPVLSKTGHSFVKQAIKREKAALAGEMSGHIFFNDRWYGFDDALYAGARLLEIVAAHKDSQHLFRTLPNTVNTPEINLAVEEADKFILIEAFIARAHFPDGEINTLDGLRVDFADGFGLIRASNTTPNLVLRFEGHSQESLDRIRGQFESVLNDLLN
jgi:phosphomannomutase